MLRPRWQPQGNKNFLHHNQLHLNDGEQSKPCNGRQLNVNEPNKIFINKKESKIATPTPNKNEIERPVLGIIQLERCIVDPNVELETTTVIVKEHSASQKCILGRDILYKVPKLRHHMKAMKSEILDWSMAIGENVF